MTRYAFANLGRANRVGPVISSMETIRDHLETVPTAVLFLNEIDEGDETKPDDHTLLKRIFTGWVRAHFRRKDPILSRGLKQTHRRWFRAAPGVPHQSPARQINESIIPSDNQDRPDVAVITGHYPAGAFNGERPAKVKAQLMEGYLNMQAIHAARIQVHHRAGRHVVWGMDCNNRKFPELHRAEVQLHHHGPDYLRAIPAPGWSVTVHHSGAVHLDIEALHELLWAEPAWKKETS